MTMNDHALKIMGLQAKIERNKSFSKKLKVLAGVCLFFSLCYCLGSIQIDFLDRSERIATNLVWIVSILVMTCIFLKDVQVIKANKASEFEIYRLEEEDYNTKKEVARITGRGLPDYVYDLEHDVPDETISLPIAYYGILVGIDIIIRVFLFTTYMI